MVDPDDWFAGSDLDSLDEAQTTERAPDREPGWLDDSFEEEAQPPGRPARVSRRGLVAIVASAAVLLVAVLAASGVFSSSGSPAPSGPATTSAVTTTPPATTAPKTPTAPKPSATVPAVVLKPGATGSDVKTLQRALASAGQSPGPIDGIYGPKTEQAISAFQTSAGITVDGVYGPETKRALEQKLNSG